MDRHPGARGTKALRAILAKGRIGADITRSELEDRFLAFLDGAGLARPRVNMLVDAAGRQLEVDCAWPSRRLIVELDGHATHATARGYEGDRALAAAGWRVVRVTWRALHEDPTALSSELRSLLVVS